VNHEIGNLLSRSSSLAGRTKQQQQVIEYLRAENEVLKEKLGKKRILLDDDQRRRLASKGKVLGRKLVPIVRTCGVPPSSPTTAALSPSATGHDTACVTPSELATSWA
jgi:hypothetical protein